MEYSLRDSEPKFRHWVRFKYNPILIQKIKNIPGGLRQYDPGTKTWGFTEKGFNLFCSISEVVFPQGIQPSIGFIPRKIDNSLEPVDWEKFRRPALSCIEPELYPYPHQKLGISQIIRNKAQGLFFAAGTGKSYATVCTGKELLDRGEITQVLIISMVKGIIKQWAHLLDRMGYNYTIILEEKLEDRPRVYSGVNTDFVLTLFTSVNSSGPVGRSKDRPFWQVFRDKASKGGQMLVIDEIHKMSEVTSSLFKSLNKMAKDATYRVPLTGTPLKSTPEKALLPLRFIAPDVFSNKGEFISAFVEQEADAFGSKTAITYKNLTRLKELFQSYGTVVLKNEVAASLPKILPAKVLNIETSKDSLKVLRGIRRGEVLKLLQNRDDVKYAQLQDLFIRVHQSLVCPSVFSDNYKNTNSLETLRFLLEDVEGKTIIFTSLVGAVNEITSYLNRVGLKTVGCCGEISETLINKYIESFNKPDGAQVLVATHQKLGAGYDNLKSASNIIFYDFYLTGGDYEQCISRVERIGGQGSISVFEMVEDNPVSQYLYEKVKLQRTLITQNIDKHSAVEDSIDLAELLKLAAEQNLFGGR